MKYWKPTSPTLSQLSRPLCKPCPLTMPTHTTPTPHTTPHSDQRGEYISRKYLERKYIEHSSDIETLLHELAEAVDSRDVKQLLQVYAEGVDLTTPLPGYAKGMTALHLAIDQEDLTSLHIVDFLLGNG